ncbi:hypothetical protein KC571_03505 [candidate division WWE3 bacterium]|uniref:Uncharacterized protein n=1 Tax=candidate division WWE3 bacterium TaxID=2053526 RepID=A0A955RPI5_UNCKA|nr:hypothetical protein [candidate division WWE3 bacterium]
MNQKGFAAFIVIAIFFGVIAGISFIYYQSYSAPTNNEATLTPTPTGIENTYPNIVASFDPLALNADSKYLVPDINSGEIIFYDLTQNELSATISIDSLELIGAVISATLSPDNTKLILNVVEYNEDPLASDTLRTYVLLLNEGDILHVSTFNVDSVSGSLSPRVIWKSNSTQFYTVIANVLEPGIAYSFDTYIQSYSSGKVEKIATTMGRVNDTSLFNDDLVVSFVYEEVVGGTSISHNQIHRITSDGNTSILVDTENRNSFVITNQVDDKVFYAGPSADGTELGGIYSHNLSSSENELISEFTEPYPWSQLLIQASPDGDNIAYSYAVGDEGGTAIYNVAGSRLFTFTITSPSDINALFSSDGKSFRASSVYFVKWIDSENMVLKITAYYNETEEPDVFYARASIDGSNMSKLVI